MFGHGEGQSMLWCSMRLSVYILLADEPLRRIFLAAV
jgi:hypothetical protein